MKKTVLAFAVAAAMGVPAVAAADTTLYGRFNVSLDAVDNDTNKSTQLASNSSRIGVRGSEDLGGGLRGVFQMEAGFDATAGNGQLASRNTFVGLAGDFGEVRLGRMDMPYKVSTLSLNFLADTVGDMHNIISKSNGSENFFARQEQVLMYVSPNFEGFQAMVAYSTDRRANGDRPGSVLVDGEVVYDGATANDRDAYSLAGTYRTGPLFLAAAYEKRNFGTGIENEEAWKIGGTYSIDDLTLALAYENIEKGSNDRNAYHLGARYNLGQAYLMGSYTAAGDWNGSDTGASQWAIGGGYNLSRRTGVYAVYANLDNDNSSNDYGFVGTGKGKGVEASDVGADVTGFSVGVWHNF